MLKILYAAWLGLSVVISTQFALEMCLTAQNRHKIHKTFILMFKVIQGHCSRWQLKALLAPIDLLLVINSNLGFISHCF